MYVSRPALGAFTKNLRNAVRSGDPVTIKVIKKLLGDNWQISVKGKLLAVKSELPLIEGKIYRGQVYLSGNTIRFRVRRRDGWGELSGKLLRDETHQKVLQVLQRTGMPATPEIIGKIANKANKMNSQDDIFLKLAVLLLDKGIDVDNEHDLIAYPFTVQDRRRNGKDREKDRRRNEHEEKAAKEPLKKQIKKYITNMINGVSKGYNSLLQLFNHLISPHENWIILPLHIKLEDEEIEGTLRLKINAPGEKPEAFALVLRANENRWSFSIENLRAKVPVMRIYAQDQANSVHVEEQMEYFSKKLTKLGIKLDDSINNESLFDGFTEIRSKGIKSVDTVI